MAGLSGPGSLVLVEDGCAYVRSDAALRIARRLKPPWPAFVVFRALPRTWRDGIYNWIARHRYRWFGRVETDDAASTSRSGAR